MKPFARLPFALGFAGATFVASQASAHVRFVYPTPRYATPAMMGSSTDIKIGPCGRMGDARTTDMSRVTVLEPGATITVQFNETVNHAGFYRISFDDDGQDAFVAPSTRAMVQTGPTFTLPVLLDNIADHAAGAYTAMVTLPNVECERCTLQLIQVMVAANVMSWDAGPDADIYFTCADIALRRTGGMGGAGGTGGAGGASAGSGGSGVSGAGGSLGAGAGGLPQGGVGGAGGAGVTAGSGGVATGGATPTGGSAGAPPAGGTAGTAASGGGAPGAGAPAGGGVPAGGATPTPAADATEEEGGCSMLPARSGSEALTAAVLALLGVLVRRRRGSRSAVA